MVKTHPLTEKKWSATRKFFTLLLIFYLLFYMFPFPLDQIPGVNILTGFYGTAIDFINLWVGKNILQLDTLQKIQNTGSGDTTFDYVKLVTFILLAILTSVIVFFATRKRINYDRLYYWTIVYARYYVGLYLIVYGLLKLFEGQFSFHDFGRLEENFGDATPMGLLWTFMGHSKIYGGFTGIMEAGAGFLLLFHNTKTLGALLSVAVMSNVVLMNFCFDVPVKLFSSHLLIISIIILAPNVRKLYNFFVLNKTETLNHCKLVFENKWKARTRAIGKGILILGFSGFIVAQGIEGMYSYGSLAPEAPLKGSYKTLAFYETANDSLKEIQDKNSRWKNLHISGTYGSILTEADSTIYYALKIDTIKKTVQFKSYKDTTKVSVLHYEEKAPKAFVLKGKFEEKDIQAEFSKKSLEDYRLVNTGFHWINEYPNNR
ncbi:hypothetical protein CLV94_2884 [Flavobacterium endophyticum]|uniref:DoxX-like protein n=1 Tax=Flavobacterium endophyticum TaxID=1540163 RepID=A0A495M5B2_9FLAO|nr:hypothetical protein [Flavobacterium endophyticum]RKS20505.1 hypothetical protein CLV94_2884 [Flavobacterium endophyticum]